MKYEVVECSGAWIVRCDGVEVNRFPQQDQALGYVAHELKTADPDAAAAASLGVRYERRSA